MEAVLEMNHRKNISDGVIGILFVIAAEVMLFAGFISAFVVGRAGSMMWPPPGQPRLPVETTAFNTLVLIASGFTIYFFGKKIRNNITSAKLLIITILLGSAFLFLQGREWVRLLNFGLTTTSSLYGAFFYTIIGAHALHVVAGLIILLWLRASVHGNLPIESLRNRITVCSLYWYFVVGIWPVLYVLVYLS